MKHFIVIILLSFIATFSLGWGEKGHHIIVKIAKAHVNKSIQDSVNKYFGNMSWEQASTWMDDIRHNPNYLYLKKWHYVNIEKNMSYDSAKLGMDNIYIQLQVAINKLNNKNNLTAEQITYNLKILFHLIGDFHQPLHVGYGIDRGGNDVKIVFLGKHTNLHAIWDVSIIEITNITFEAINALTLKKSFNYYFKNQGVNLMLWMNQTRKLLNSVYNFTNPIGSKYIENSKAIIKHQLLIAGLRLAYILNNIFSK